MAKRANRPSIRSTASRRRVPPALINVFLDLGREGLQALDDDGRDALVRSFEPEDGEDPEDRDAANTDMPLPDDGASPLVLNGLDGESGRYLPRPASARALAALVRERAREGTLTDDRGTPAPRVEVDDLASAGWGLLYARDTPEAVKDALSPLIDHRKHQAGERFRLFDGEDAVRPGERFTAWRARAVGSAFEPAGSREGDPYYLLLVGAPDAISFDFQQQAAVDYALGRLWFDQVEDFARYAANVLRAEDPDTAAQPRRVSVLGVDNPDDAATTYSTCYLARPLSRRLEDLGDGLAPFAVDAALGGEATKAAFSARLGGAETPALVITASHGLGPAHTAQPAERAGALVCADWPGPLQWQDRIPDDFLFTAEDLAADADLTGLITFHFACFSAGVPREDSFTDATPGCPRMLSPRPRLARLPQALLAHPRGALAAIGHVDRAWGWSFVWPGADAQPHTIGATVEALLRGSRAGHATGYLGQRYAALAAELNEVLRDAPSFADQVVADLWTALTDARGYLLLGDPAVQLRLQGDES